MGRLVLTRRLGEKILMKNGEIKVEISHSYREGTEFRIVIDAPDDIDIFREEIYEEVKKSGINARKVSGYKSLK